jgi:3-dehydroquinate synthase
MHVLNVDLGARSYPIYIGSGLLCESSLIEKHVRGSQLLIVSNETVAPFYLEKVKQLFCAFQCSVVILPDGERFKTIETLNAVFDALLLDGHSRSTTLVALGGGVIGDMTGFAAACYQRGVAFIQIPTTLLAQVDSSVGGKTGVNHVMGKNMIGAFHQPTCVLIDVNTLLTLPNREFRSGLAEIIKYGLIGDFNFFCWIDCNLEALCDKGPEELIHAIASSCRSKALVVAQDETESGVRALLNLGHTFGHAIESWQKYMGFLHGEAVAIGTVIAARLSVQMGFLQEADFLRIRNLFIRAGLPVIPPVDMDSSAFIELMQRDKKVMDGKIRLVLLRSIGDAVISDAATIAEMRGAIDSCRV